MFKNNTFREYAFMRVYICPVSNQESSHILQDLNSCKLYGLELLYPRVITDEAAKPLYNVTDTINALHRAIAGLQLSSICNKTDLLLHNNNKFDNVNKKKGFNTTTF